MSDAEPGIYGGTKIQDLGRRINNRIARRVGPERGNQMWVVCECANGDCEAMIQVTVEQYLGVRKGDYHFLVLAGHQVPTLERIVARTDNWVVVEKMEEYRHYAEEMAREDRDDRKQRASG